MALRSLRLTSYLRRVPKFSSSALRHNPLLQPDPDSFLTSAIISPAVPSQLNRPFTSTTSLFRKVFDPDTDEIGPDTILFEGCDYNHWLITMDFPKDHPPTREQMIETYVNTAAQVFGSVEEAKKKIYALSTTTYQGFQVECSEETSNKFQNLPGVVFVLPDSYIDPVNKEYGGDKYVNGEIFPRPPPIMYRRRPDRRERNYGPPEQQQHYQNQPPQQPNYRPPPQQNYTPPPQQQNYTPSQQQQNYTPPQQQQSYGAPSQPNNRPPPHQNYGPPPQQQSYGAPQQPNSRLPPQQNYGPSPQQNNPSQPPRPNYGAPPQPAYGGHQQQNYPPQPQQGYYGPPPPHSYAPQHQPSYGHSGSPPNYGPSIERNQSPPYSGNADQVQHGNPHAQGYEHGRFQGGGN